MEVKIGVQDTARELTLEVDDTLEGIEETVADAIAAGGVLSFGDTKGRRVVVPVAKLAYVDIGHGVAGQVGFRS